MKKVVLATASAVWLAMSVAVPALAQTKEEKAAAREEEKRLGSLYLRCDGKPNNMTDGESFARFLGAITLLALFAPAPETPDASKRLFGEEGVAACTALIDGEKAEGNGLRRIPLILARALHRIEAKDYAGALPDVEMARSEAAALGLVGNPYFDRSMGLSFANIEAEARLRMGDAEGARTASLKRAEGMNYSLVPLMTANDYAAYAAGIPPEAERLYSAQARILPATFTYFGSRLEEEGRFAEAPAKMEAVITTLEELKPEHPYSSIYARAAISHALAGNWDEASKRAEFARSNLAQRRADGVAEEDASSVVELLDFYDVLATLDGGDAAAARRNFSARSQWLAPTMGAVMEANRRLREGAAEEELFGALAKTPQELWDERKAASLATKLQKDSDNRTLFNMILPYASIGDFEDRSKETWRIEKTSRMMSESPTEDSGHWRIWATGNPQTSIDSIMLHAALQAKSRGKEGFTMILTLPDAKSLFSRIMTGSVQFLDRGEVTKSPERFIPAEEVIAELSPLIPSPEELKQRKKNQSKVASAI